MPKDGNPRICQRSFLLRLQDGAELYHVYHHCCAEFRNDPNRAQGVFHHRAATGTELDQAYVFRCAHLFPHGSNPQADQFTEHLAYFRRGYEIAPRAKRIMSGVVAVCGIGETQSHVFCNRHWPARQNTLPDFRL
jgi:hypothetical protein